MKFLPIPLSRNLKMRRIQSEIVTSSSSPSSLPSPSPSPFPEKETPTSPSSKISPALLFIIVILAVMFFIAGLLHLLVRFLIKHGSGSSPASHSGRYPQMSGPNTVQRQLQQLFHLHDSGLDQSFIDSLPVFMYKEIKGLKEPFDCAVCLCEFSDKDKLRLLPLCSHAFHIDCIDTWLQSNSTCPLCRGNLFASDFSIEENPCFNLEDDELREGGEEDELANRVQVSSMETEIGSEKRVFPVRLGKFKSSNGDVGNGETSSSNLGARRCYSMGSCQYVVPNSELQVILNRNNNNINRGFVNGGSMRLLGKTVNHHHQQHHNADMVDVEGKRINSRSKGDSFSVSKIWLWSKKGKFPSSSSETQMI